MSDIALEFSHVWKKFKRGEKFNSLRDLIPSMTKRLFSGNHRGELEEKEFWALKDVSFQVKCGETLGIIGHNGAGKSTILKLLTGILRPDKGGIEVNGRQSALIEVGAGFHPDLTGRENVYLNGAILGMKKSEIDKKFNEIVEFSGISEFMDTPVKRYSSGMYARLGFSIAAHVDPDILLVDEVLSVGDMKFQQKCLKKMLSFKNSGRTVIFVSHHLESINTLCSKTALISNGQLKRIGVTGEVIKDYIGLMQEVDQETTDRVSIWNVSLTDENKKNSEMFHPGQKAYLSFKLKCDIPLHECLLGFLINRASDDLPICDYNLPLNLLKPSGNISESVDGIIAFDVNLLRSSYTISLHVYHYPSAKILIWNKNAVFFSVEERISYNGIAHLNPILVNDDGA